MSGQTRYEQYLESLENMCGPYTKDDIPDIQLDIRGIVAYAKANGKAASALSDEELAPFILNASVEELRAARLKPSDKEKIPQNA